MKQTTNKPAVNNDQNTAVRLPDTKREPIGYEPIEQIVIEREVWEDTIHRTSNEMLYGLLDKCYRYYFLLKGGDALAKKVGEDLQLHINMKGYKFLKTTHTLTKIVKCVFGSERRVTSTYSLVLRAALSENVKVGDVPAFIRKRGGVHEISVNKDESKATVDKVAIAKGAIAEKILAEVSGEAFGKSLDSNKAGQEVVIVATQMPNGSLALKAITYSQTAVKAALTAFYSENKKAISEKVVERSGASNDELLDKAIHKAA